jgi:alpha-amylase/alpha-mannosidase (GH57 family)
MSKYICVHGHFYQPPRENAWLEKIEYQDSAAPYHDWNERITQECYAPNGVSRILNDAQKIVDIVNNYAKMSFNFGPTLLSWMQANQPQTYQSIIDADAKSMAHFGGHGSAMAQVYNHIIMPLASRRDKETQVVWGIRDFESRFQRKPMGMWLAETAADLETLEVLVENGIKYTVLAPRQAKRFRRTGTSDWQNGIDPMQPYVCHLPSGKSIHLFFYDGKRSEAVAFKGLLKDGKEFANHLTSAFDERNGNQLLHIATDGESYGHHHRYGDMALAYCLRYIENNKLAQVTNYSQYLELNPPQHEAEIHENSSWSCVHGVERWRSDCGCNSGGRPDWNQAWRKPLRESLNWLRDRSDEIYIKGLAAYKVDPQQVRNGYISVVLNRTPDVVQDFLHKHFGNLNTNEQTQIMRLLELQRNNMLMFTSCGWFFDEISGIETVQILQYARRSIQLARSVSSQSLDKEFRKRLAEAKSNVPEYGTGAQVYIKFVLPSEVTLTHIGMHYAVSSLFAEDPNDISVLNYTCRSSDFQRIVQGTHRLAVGRTHVKSRVTFSEKDFSFVVLYMGQHHVIGKAFESIPRDEYLAFNNEVTQAFSNSNISKVIELFRRYPEQRSFSFFDMFKDEQLKMLNGILAYSLDLATSSYSKINDRNYSIINVMRNSGLNPPEVLVKNLEMLLSNQLRQLFKEDPGLVKIQDLRRIIKDLKNWGFKVDHKDLNFICSNKLHSMLSALGTIHSGNVQDTLVKFHNMKAALELLARIGVYPELNEVQDTVFNMLRSMGRSLPSSIRAELLEFAAYVNFDIRCYEPSEVPA